MKTKNLTGYLPDRDAALLSRILADAGYDTDGIRLSFDAVIADDNVDDEVINFVASKFKPIEAVYSLSPQMPLVEVGNDAVVTVIGAPDETITLTINGTDTLDVVLDASGQATKTFVPSVAGEYVIKDGHGSICVIKAVD